MKKKLDNFLQAIFNIFVFLPYYFSVTQLIKTLFKPWKNLIVKKTTPGFSFSEWFGRLSFNLISSGMGFTMRIIVIVVFITIQVLFILSIPLILLVLLFALPFNYFFSQFHKTEDEHKEILKTQFIKEHLLKEENRPKVEQWFEIYYQNHITKISWWKLASLFSIPPLARDWNMGYTPTLDQFGKEHY